MKIREQTVQTLREYWIVLVAPLLLLGPIIFRGQVLYWGTPSLQFVPWWSYALDSLRQGVLPLWNSLNGFGSPLIANYQLAFFYPPNWILLLFGALGGVRNQAAAIAWGFMLLSILHLSWAGLGMALLLRKMGFRWLGQIIGALSFGLSGYIVARLGFFSMVWVYAWLPWVIYTADTIVTDNGTGQNSNTNRIHLSLSLAICLMMQLLAGHAQLTWYSVLFTCVWVIVGSLRRGGWKRLLTTALSLGLAGFVAAGISAVQLFPTLEYLIQSQRASAYGFEEALTYSFWPWRFLTLFVPDFFGNPANGDFWGYASYWEDHLYFGMLPSVLALATLWLLVRGMRNSHRSRWWWFILFGWASLIITFVLAMGRYTPVFAFLYHHVPTFDMFQAPARYMVWAAFLFPILTAVGIEHWRCPTNKGLYWFRLGTAGAFAVTLGAGLAWFFMQNIKLTFIRATAMAGLWALGFGILTLVIPITVKKRREGVWRWCVILWTLADLLVTGWSLNPGIDWRFYHGRASSPVDDLPLNSQRFFLASSEEYDLKFGRFMRFKDFRPVENAGMLRQVMLPNLNLLDGVALANNFDPLVPERYAQWISLINTIDFDNQQGWLKAAGIGWVERIDASQPAGVRFDPIASSERWHWYPCAQQVEDQDEAFAQLADSIQSGADLPSEILVELEKGTQAELCHAGVGTGASVVLAREEPNLIVLNVSVEAPGWLVVADTWYPGWRATIDGNPVAIVPANILFRAVQIPAGKHQLFMEYRPISFYFGAMFSILIMLSATLIWIKRGRER